MLRNILLKTLRDERRSLIFWGIGTAALTILTVLFYPSVREMPELNDLMGDSDSFIRAFVGNYTDLTSPEGFLNSQIFFVMLPVLFLVFAIARGSGAIAGEEEKGTLDMLLSCPVSRWRVVVEKFAAMIVAILVLTLVLWLSMVIGAVSVGMDIGFGRMAEASLSAAMLAAVFGALALALGSARGKRGLSIGVAGALGVLSYFINSLGPLVDFLEPLTKVSPFYYYLGADPLTNGLSLLHSAVLIGLTIALFAISVATFERRDLAV